ncbi:hypothetical protein SteCoe_38352 [Stentor coeruleus]|uniref:Arrestin-like N-terminal domain-containing protein n=1 Tax=Stentor coeruleus TaxID=5963 RepID=A0A1R2ALF8_9CILI|nr:hypothetical protein SteCoe_38352 [Stentor coeruleus]
MSNKYFHVSIDVKLDKPFYHVGSPVVGTVDFNVNQTLKPMSLNLLYFCKVKTLWSQVRNIRPNIQNQGRQNQEDQVTWFQNDQFLWLRDYIERQRRYEPQIIVENNGNKAILHSYNISLAIWNINVEANKYSFPFSFFLPDNLPGTFLCQTENCTGKNKT